MNCFPQLEIVFQSMTFSALQLFIFVNRATSSVKTIQNTSVVQSSSKDFGNGCQILKRPETQWLLPVTSRATAGVVK